jgi:tellurite resistance protein
MSSLSPSASPGDAHTGAPAALAHLPVTLFSVVMGLAGLAIAWKSIFPVFAPAQGFAWLIGLLASALLVFLFGAYALKALRHQPEVLAELRHPVRLNFFPAASIGLLLLSVFWVEHTSLARMLWTAGAILHLGLTLFVMNSWIHHSHYAITHANPAWFIPVVGNIIVPLSGVPLGHGELSWFFFSIGLLFWLVLLTIVIYRLFFHEALPPRLTPTLFILLAPPSVGFLAYVGLNGGLDNGARLLYYVALFLALLLASNGVRFWRTPFFLSSWAYSFPLAALSIATMKMAVLSGQPVLKWLAEALLLVLTVIVAWLVVRTLQAVRQGKVCIPE